MIQHTFAEQLDLIRERIEAIDVRIDGIEEELKALNVLMRQLLKVFDRMADAIERVDG